MPLEERPEMAVDRVREEVNTKNVIAAINYTKETRAFIEQFQARMEYMEKEIGTIRNLVDAMSSQIGVLRGEVYGGGPTA